MSAYNLISFRWTIVKVQRIWNLNPSSIGAAWTWMMIRQIAVH